MKFERLNPVTKEIASSSEAMDADRCRKICDRAQAGFAAWSAKGPAERRAILNKAADELQARQDQFIKAMVTEIGATPGWAGFNVAFASNMAREAAAITTQIEGKVIPSEFPRLAMAIREPVGVVLGIAPWNAPVILGVRAIAVPLACGNSVVFKASESCPETHRLIVEAFHAAGVPEEALGFVTNRPEDAAEIVGELIDHQAVRRINFTGSTRVGRIIAERAARHLKPCVLELGGKAPLIILEDADIGEAVKAASFGAFMNSGQICMSTERIIVVDAVADEFSKQFADKVKTYKTGDPSGEPSHLGAVVDDRTVGHVNELIADALGAGASLSVDGRGDSVVMAPSVVEGVTPEMRLFSEESFGPVVGVIRARDEAHAQS